MKNGTHLQGKVHLRGQAYTHRMKSTKNQAGLDLAKEIKTVT